MDLFCCGSSQRDTKEPNTAEIVFYESDQPSTVQEFTFQRLFDATHNFSPECVVGEGSFGNVYRGKLRETAEVSTVSNLSSAFPLSSFYMKQNHSCQAIKLGWYTRTQRISCTGVNDEPPSSSKSEEQI